MLYRKWEKSSMNAILCNCISIIFFWSHMTFHDIYYCGSPETIQLIFSVKVTCICNKYLNPVIF